MGKFSGKKCRLLTVMWLTAFFFFVEIVVGYVTNSMALVADSFHMLSDIAALVISFLSIKMSPKKWSKNTFGWARAEVLGALVNAVFLVAICFSITIEACKRFIEMEPIHEPKLLVIVGVIGLLVNVVGLVLLFEHGSAHGHSHGLTRNHSKLAQLADIDEDENAFGADQLPPAAPAPQIKAKPSGGHGHSHGGGGGGGGHHGHSHSSAQMNMRGAFLHVLSDALGSVIVIISALTVWLTDWEYKHYLDPALSIVLVVLILHSVWPLLRESALILLQTVPTHIQVDAIERRLLEKVDGVLAVHEFHVWQLAGDRIIASAHIRCRNLSEYMKIAEKVKEFFHNEGIHSTTIQPEFVEGAHGLALVGAANGMACSAITANGRLSTSAQDGCALDCPITDKGCVQATCCQTNNKTAAPGSPSSSPFMLRQRSSRPGQSDVESGALLDTSGRPISGGEPATGMIVDEMPETTSDTEMMATTEETATLVVNGNEGAEGATTVGRRIGEESSHLNNSNLAIPAATPANKKANV